MTRLEHAVRNVNQIPGAPRAEMSLLVCVGLLQCILLEGETNHDLPFEDSAFGNTSEKMSDLYPIKSERLHVDVVLERWKDDRESILLVRVSTPALVP
jgi:hypothetical protein